MGLFIRCPRSSCLWFHQRFDVKIVGCCQQSIGRLNGPQGTSGPKTVGKFSSFVGLSWDLPSRLFAGSNKGQKAEPPDYYSLHDPVLRTQCRMMQYFYSLESFPMIVKWHRHIAARSEP
jgi:hypothetical protein